MFSRIRETPDRGFAACRSARSGGVGCPAERHGQVDAWRVVDHLRHAGRRDLRAMRDDAERGRRGPPGDRAVGRGAAHRRQQGRDPARACAARRAAAQRARPQRRRQGHRPRLFRALLPGRLLCRGDPRKAAARYAEDRHRRRPSSCSRRPRKASASRSTSRVSPTGSPRCPEQRRLAHCRTELSAPTSVA